MKNTYRLLIGVVCMSAVFACSQFEENIEGSSNVAEKVEMTFTASIEKADTLTKTTLEGSLSDASLRTVWTPGDEIGIVRALDTNGSVEKFVNTLQESSENGVFSGAISMGSEYCAAYPYTDVYTMPSSETRGFIVSIPKDQKYVPGSFDEETAPMVAKAKYGQPFEFQNLCGLLAIRLTGVESVRSVTFSGRDASGNLMNVGGNYFVDMSYKTEPELCSDYHMIPGLEQHKSITLVCDEPVQLSETEATPFFFVLPPATYSSIIVKVTTDDGKVMMKEGRSPLVIERAHAKPTAGLNYAETEVIDLSVEGTANCYIVSNSGLYSFDADVIGNGEFGIIKGAGFHTNDARISPLKAKLLWEDKEGIIIGESYAGGKISFFATGLEGNAVIAAVDSDDTILWSWHIWSTDKPEEHIYTNSMNSDTYTVLDRNLGATRADRGSGEEWKDAQGLAYQWGRKDPFTKYRGYDYTMEGFGYSSYYFNVSSDQVSIAKSIKHPNTFFGMGHSYWMDENMYSSLWTPAQKTIYDPCPPGYMVAANDLWRSFTKTGYSEFYNYTSYNVSGQFDNGLDFIYDGTNTTYYPVTWYIEYLTANVNDWSSNTCYIWTANNSNSTDSYILEYYYNSEGESWIAFDTNRSKSISNGHMVRCVKDSAIKSVSTSIEQIDRENVTSTSAPVKARVATYSKNITISERGFVYGTTNNVSLEKSDKITCGNGIGEFEASITGLTPQTKYYVKAYAIASDGLTYYSSLGSFITPGDGGIVNLSSGSSANSYIVYPVKGTYTFDLVKGNSKESVGEAESADILWETYNTTESVTLNSVIESAEIEGDKIKFTLPENAQAGNALIAAKNVKGEILWSWHIWVVDFDPETTEHTYPSGAIMMDRNLGALTDDVRDVRSFGLFYQWGRKDPFMGYANTNLDSFAESTGAKTYIDKDAKTNTLEYSIKHPETVISDSDWNYQSDYWNTCKTMYDPCPVGWKVADRGAWYNFQYSVSYPTSGCTNGKGTIGSMEWSYYIWANSRVTDGMYGNNCAYRFFSNNVMYYDVYNEASVRCMKDSGASGDKNEGFTESDDYEW